MNLATALSRRSRLTLGQTYSRSNTRYLRETDPEGLPLPTSAVSNAVSSVGLSRELAQRWQLSLNGSYTVRRYDNAAAHRGRAARRRRSNQPFDRSRDERVPVVRLRRKLVRRRPEPEVRSESIRDSWACRRRIRDRFSVELAGGAAYLESTGSFYPSGRASLTASGRKASFSAYYARDFGQAFGYGTQMIGDLAGASASWLPVRRVTFNARYNFGYRRDPADESYYVRSHIASVGLGWEVGGGVSFGASYSRERNETQGRRVVEGSRASVSLSYGVNWH